LQWVKVTKENVIATYEMSVRVLELVYVYECRPITCRPITLRKQCMWSLAL